MDYGANLLKAPDVLEAIREATKEHCAFEAAEFNDNGSLILRMFDGTIWVLSQKGLKKANE